jgi:hypothetical protein
MASGAPGALINWHFADAGEGSALTLEATTTIVGDDPTCFRDESLYRMGCLNVLGALDDSNVKEAWDFLVELYTWQWTRLNTPASPEIVPRYMDVLGVDKIDAQPPSFRVE